MAVFAVLLLELCMGTSTHEFKSGQIALGTYSPYKAVPWVQARVEAEECGFSAMLDQIE